MFPEGTTVKVTAVTLNDDNTYTVAGAAEEKSSAFLIEFTDKDGKEVVPNGAYTLSLPVPADYTSPAVYRIKDGKRTLVSGENKDGFYTVKAKEAGVFAVIQSADNSSSSSPCSSSSSSSSGGNGGSSSSAASADKNPETGAAAGGALLTLAAGAIAVSKKRKDK